ncbi:MAG: hypothetical protein DI596_09255, partial [Azospira oryzae]
MTFSEEAVTAVARAIGIDAQELARRMAYLEFDDTDVRLLTALHERLSAAQGQFADDFYVHLLRFDETRRFIPDAPTLERLKRAQAEYFASLTAGNYSMDYLLNRVRIGLVHRRIGLEPKWYLGAYGKYLGWLLPVLWRLLGDDVEKFLATYRALLKLVLLDVGIALDTYFHADRHAMVGLRRYAEDIVASLPVGLIVVDRALQVLSANRAFRDMLGLSETENVAGRPVEALLPLPGLRSRALEVLASGTAVQGLEASVGGRCLRLAIAGIRLAEEEEEEEERLLLVAEDISKEEQLRDEARAHETRYRDLVEGLEAIVWEADAQTFAFTFVSRRAEAILGYPVERWLHQPDFWANLIHPEDRSQALAAYREARAKGRGAPEYRVIGSDGRVVWLRDRVHAVTDKDGRVLRLRGVMVDITERKRAEERIEQLAFYDPLTGLPNRALCLDRLRQALASAQRQGGELAVMFIDLDLFKHINDSLGHATGDRLLEAAARRLSSCVRESDTVARLGGDEFVVVLNGITEEAMTTVAQKILEALREPFVVEGHVLHLTCSIGVALHPRDGSEAQTLLRNADAAMYRAKALGRNNAQFYTEEMNRKALERLTLEQELRQALARGEFVLHYQPRVNLASGEITGLEALVRWQHPEKGLIAPDRFIAVAEETGLILPLSEWVLREACAQAKAWERAFAKPASVAVNLSARQFREKDLVEKVTGILRETGLDPDRLELEITESVVMDQVEEALATLARLRALGVRLAIDDFGTGYSSLSQLKRLPLSVLKIDKSFVDGIPSDPDDVTIVTTILSMAHAMKLKVVAEGVETGVQLAFLRQHRCDEMQGYFFSKPLPAEAAQALLREGRRLAPMEEAEAAHQRTLLLVDDEAPILSALGRALRRSGYRILKATSARAALDLLARHPVGVIVCGLRMPEMSGVEFLRRVKQLYPETVRIVLSGYTDLQSVTEAINEGAVYKFLTKPWEDEWLRAHVQEAFEHYE